MKYMYIVVFVYRIETVKIATAEATSLKFTYTPYVFETFLQVVEMITSETNVINVLSSHWENK